MNPAAISHAIAASMTYISQKLPTSIRPNVPKNTATG
jgi:hypothetical protein